MLRNDNNGGNGTNNNANQAAPAYPNLSGAVSAAGQAILSQDRLNMTGLTNRPNDLQLTDVIRYSPQENAPSHLRTDYILREFNKFIAEGDSCFTESFVRGDLIQPGQFLLGHKNKKPELIGPQNNRYIARQLTADPTVKSTLIGYYSQNELFFGVDGSYVINVPVGHFAKGMSGNIPVLFGPGPHVIHDPLFVFNKDSALVKQTDIYIKHGNLNILRIPYGMYAKVMIGTKPLLLEARPEPYVFNDPLFTFDLANGMVAQTTPYIQHGTIHVLRIPAGKIATVWDGTVPKFLEATEAPHVFNNPVFRLDRKNASELFYNATDSLITHGYKKRLMVHTGQVAVTWNNGVLKIIGPTSDSEASIIDSANHLVSDEFLSTGIMNLEFPSRATKAKRLEDNPHATVQELSYELFNTKDSLKVGVKLYVAIRIKDPELALQKLIDLKGLLDHVESCATVDMGMAIQQCTSLEFLNSNQTKRTVLEEEAEVEAGRDQNIQYRVKKQLTADLAAIGIELLRMNFESPQIMDPDIAKKMSAQSLATAEAGLREALLEQNYRIAKRTAEQEANTKRIALQQQNDAKISTAQADKDAALIEREAKIIRAEGDKGAALLKGQPFLENRTLFEMEMMRMQMDALGRAQLVTPQMASVLTSGIVSTPYTLFSVGQQGSGAGLHVAELSRNDDRGQVAALRGR